MDLTQQILEMRSRGMRFCTISEALGVHENVVVRAIYEDRRQKVRGADDEQRTKNLQRLMTGVIVTQSDCWERPGSTNRKGYTWFCMNNKGGFAHRAMFEIAIRPLKRGECVCHTCDNPRCINPSHMWAGTKGQNTADMHKKRRSRNRTTTHCCHGHEYTEANTYWSKGSHGPKRNCRECARIRMRSPKYRERANEWQRERRASKSE